MATNISNKQRDAINKQLLVGYRKHGGKTAMVVHERKKSAAEIERDRARRAGAEDRVAAARAALQGAILERSKIDEETQAVFDAVRSMAIIMYGRSPEILADYGLAPRKPRRTPTVEEKSRAAAKRRETRKLRGRRQRMEIRADSPTHAAPPPDGHAVSITPRTEDVPILVTPTAPIGPPGHAS